MLVSIIIPTYNRGHFILKTLTSFLNQSIGKENYEIIIANNNSTDGTKDLVHEFINQNQDHNIRYFLEPRQGVHYARNSSAKIALGEYLYYTDDDMIAEVNLIEELLVMFKIDDRVASVTGKVLPLWLTTPPEWVIKHCNNYYLSLSDPIDLFIVTRRDPGVFSCHQMMKKDVFMKSGGFNPENTKGVWIGDGETGLNLKIRSMGYLLALNAKSVIHHMIPESRMTQKYLNKRLYNQGFCDSYTNYKRYKYSKFGLSVMNAKFLITSLRYFILFMMYYSVSNDFWHVQLAKCFHFLGRTRYNIKLMFSQQWRDLVLKENWINE